MTKIRAAIKATAMDSHKFAGSYSSTALDLAALQPYSFTPPCLCECMPCCASMRRARDLHFDLLNPPIFDQTHGKADAFCHTDITHFRDTAQ